jgi:hypothetical protein
MHERRDAAAGMRRRPARPASLPPLLRALHSLLAGTFGPDRRALRRRLDQLADLPPGGDLAGETGSGKTTQLPKICLELGRGVSGLIGHTQPRRIAARSVARRVAEELGVDWASGRLPGALHRGGRRRQPHQADDRRHPAGGDPARPLASAYDTLIIDEAHERSLNIDFLLGYLKTLLPKRPDLKVIITSATIDVERFARHFADGAPMCRSRVAPSGRGALPAAAGEGEDERRAHGQRCDRRDPRRATRSPARAARRHPGVPAGEREIREPHQALEAAQACATPRCCRCTPRLSGASRTACSSPAGKRASCWPPTSPKPR